MTSWVLIITASSSHAPPAVIGGYGSKEEAVAAGEAALGAPERRSVDAWGKHHGWPADRYGVCDWWDREKQEPRQPPYPGHEHPEWHSYTVVPGAASSGPEGP